MDGRKAKLKQFIFMDDAGDLVLSGEIANTLEGFEAKSFAKQNSDKCTMESRFLEPPGETQIGSRNQEFEKSKVASNYANTLFFLIRTSKI